ncbi:MAG: CvpA family protein [Beduini sp.]|uniref:CvpA family protein n=1 Tax=Beduini sp. TaxID=1922300 RepID=UPI00399FD085
MGNLNPSFILDIIVIGFLLISMLVGYFRGFTTRFFSFILSILAFFLAFILSKPVSLLFTFQIRISGGAISEVLKGFYPLIYQVIAFIILLVIFMILKVVILFVFRNTIKRFIDTLAFSRFIDGILGSALSLVEGLIFTFIALCVMMMPFIKDGNKIIDNSTIASHILDLVPEASKQLNALSDTYNLTKNLDFSSFSLEKLDKNSLSTLKTMITSAQDMGLVTPQDVNDLVESYRSDIEQAQDVKVDQETKKQIDELLNIPGIPQDIKDIVNNKIIVE